MEQCARHSDLKNIDNASYNHFLTTFLNVKFRFQSSEIYILTKMVSDFNIPVLLQNKFLFL